MTQEHYERELGSIETSLKHLEAGQAIIFQKLDEIRSNGCALGKQHEKDIQELKEKPGKIIGLAVAVSGLVSSLLGGIAWIWSHGK